MGNSSSRNDHFPIPPGFMPPTYPMGYPPYGSEPSSSWNPFKRNRLKKREKALREYLYTTPMIFQYPGAFAVAQPGQNLVQPGIPQVHSAMPVSAIGADGYAAPLGMSAAAQMAAPMGFQGVPPGAPAQAMQTAYPAFDYSAYTRPRGDPAPVVPRRSHRSQRHRHDRRHHRSRRRTPSPSTESSNTESESSSYASPSSQESPTYPRHSHRHHRSNSNGYNPLPRPPKDVLASTPFRGILSQLPSAHYTPWGVSNEPTVAMPVPQTFDDRPRTERGGFFRRRKRNDNRTTPSLSAAAGMLAQPFLAPAGMGMPEPQFAPPGAGAATPSFVPPVIPSGSQMRMPSPEPYPSGAGGPPGPSVIPQNTSMQMPSPAPAGATPFIGQGLATPMGSAPPPPGQTMPISMTASPSGGPVPMPTPLVGGSMPMPMPSPMAGGGPAPMPVPAPGGVFRRPPSTMSMRSPGPGGRAPVLAFNGYGDYAGLLYHSPHSVMYEDELYPTALHLFEALKFYEHRPDIADRIRECARVEDVAVISAQYEPDTRRDWGNIALMKMDEVLYYKFRQHGDLRNLLLDTYPADLVYSEPGDHFWGDGAGAGRNELGNSLVRVRERLRNEGGG